jgi:hypothetical protein
MKKLLVVLVLMLSTVSFGQEYKTEDKALTGVFEVAGKSKAEIFSAINKWISINYNSGKSVTQLSDAEGGNIIVKGINSVNYKNIAKILYPKMKSLPDELAIKFNHLTEINIKDNKYRIIYTIANIDVEPDVAKYITPELGAAQFACININGATDTAILLISNIMDTNFKDAKVSDEKRELLSAAIKPMYDEMNSDLVTDMKSTMISINKSVASAKADTW